MVSFSQRDSTARDSTEDLRGNCTGQQGGATAQAVSFRRYRVHWDLTRPQQHVDEAPSRARGTIMFHAHGHCLLYAASTLHRMDFVKGLLGDRKSLAIGSLDIGRERICAAQ